MVKSQKKKRRKRFGLFHYIILAVFIYIIVIFWRQERLLSKLEAEKEKNIMEVEELEKDIGELKKQIKDSDSLKFVEKIAREELGMVKPREIIYIDKNKKKNSIFDKQ